MTTPGFLTRLEQRWDRRQVRWDGDGLEPCTIQTGVEIETSAEAVWEFVMSPDTGVLLDHTHIKSFPVPCTPEGVGQQWCTLNRAEGGGLEVNVLEIVELEPPKRLVIKVLTAPVPFLKVVSITESTQGCRYTVSYGLRVVAGTKRQVTAAVQKAVDEDAAKLKAILESGVRLVPAEQASVPHAAADGVGFQAGPVPPRGEMDDDG